MSSVVAIGSIVMTIVTVITRQVEVYDGEPSLA